MMDSSEASQLQRDLEAFADGELDTEQSRAVLQRIAADPLLAQEVVHQQAMGQAIRRMIDASTPDVPDALRAQIAQMVQQPSSGQVAALGPQRQAIRTKRTPYGLSTWTPVLVAALFFVSALIFLAIGARDNRSWVDARYTLFVHRHLDCSDKPSKLQHQAKFVQDVHQLSDSLPAFLGGPLQADLDLSDMGYEFVAVGECNVPGPRSVHLIYRAKDDPTGTDTISLWIRLQDGTMDIEPNKPYIHTGHRLANPLMLWQQADMIYYLVGDTLATVESAARTLRATG